MKLTSNKLFLHLLLFIIIGINFFKIILICIGFGMQTSNFPVLGSMSSSEQSAFLSPLLSMLTVPVIPTKTQNQQCKNFKHPIQCKIYGHFIQKQLSCGSQMQQFNPSVKHATRSKGILFAYRLMFILCIIVFLSCKQHEKLQDLRYFWSIKLEIRAQKRLKLLETCSVM